MYRIDPTRIDLALEFRRQPFGRHSPELHAVLMVMRGLPLQGKHMLVMTKPHREWRLAVMDGDPLRPRLLDGIAPFADPADAEWPVFKLRWKALTGETLDVE